MRPGQILEVLTDHPPAVDNIPRSVAIHGHRLVHAPVREGAVCHRFIRVAGASAARRVPSCQRS
jgi:TusA-related sulfurtransferase